MNSAWKIPALANNIEPSARKEGHRVPNAAPRHRHITPQMRAALYAARSQPLRRVHDDRPGRPSWPAHPCTLHALVRRELARRAERLSRQGHRVEEWWITDLGVEVLRPVEVTRRPGPLLLAEGWPDFTRDAGRAMRGEPGLGPLPADEPEAWAA